MSDPRKTPSIYARGAVDLSSLRSAAQPTPASPAAQRGGAAAASGAPAAGVTVIDVTEATFQSEVLERSLTTPVVVDFWAAWCQPCKQLSPVLERLAIQGGGSWVLAKVDVDANPRIAQAFQVQSIPTVYAVVGGRPVDGFAGVQPESTLRQWIDALLKAAGVSVAPPQDPRLDAAEQALLAGDLDAAEQAYKKILAESPSDTAAEAGLARVELARRTAGVDPAEALAKAQAAPDDVTAQLLAADIEVLTGRAKEAYDRLLGVVRGTTGDDRERARAHLVSLFTIAGPDDPTVATARRALASALF
jgi:putative thioredoxin